VIRRSFPVAVALALGSLAACGGSSGSGGDDTPAVDAGPDVVTTVDVTTSKGVFTLEVHSAWAPNGTARFLELVDAHFYDDARFFRVIAGFVAQFGINGTPATNAMWENKTIPDDPVVKSNTKGFVSFAATSAANSRTTQLFVNLVNNSELDAMHFAPFAMVTAGMDVVGMLDSEYGETPDQDMISSQGNSYLTANFPNLDYIMTTQVK
jgi:cyclophilin family peptidyl-prolyl cis-trans isomerase